MRPDSVTPLIAPMMDYPLTLTQILRRTQKYVADNYIISKTVAGALHRISYGDWYRRVCRLAHVLTELGICLGDRVGTLAWNSSEHLELYFGVPCIGAVLHTLNLRYSTDQLVYVINHAEDGIIFVDASLVPLLEGFAHRLTSVKRFVVMGAGEGFTTTLSPHSFYENLLLNGDEEFAWPVLDERSAAGLCYTSGTTGNPKGVLYAHRSQFLHTLSMTMGDTVGLRKGDTLMPAVPMFHANAWGLPYAAALVGANLVFPGMHLQPSTLAGLIQDCGVTVAAGVPTLWIGLHQELLAHKYKTETLRALMVGGTAMPQALIQSFEKNFGIPVLHLWGMTELSPLGTTAGLHSETAQKTRQGPIVPCLEMRIVGDDQAELPWNDQAMGELEVRGPWVISSYFRDSSGNPQFTPDGWFKTGDIATINSEGSMRIMDRSKDLVKSGGEWISSVELENALMAHPQVLEATVIAIPDPKWGERPIALVVAKGEAPTAHELSDHLRPHFAKFWIPDQFHFVTSIPKTSVGKFDKKEIRNNSAFIPII